MIVGKRHGSVMAMRNRAHETETEAVSRRAAARFEADEAVENDLAIGCGNARPVISHLDDCFFAAEDANLYLASIGIFESIVEQIGERLGEEVAIASDCNGGFR